MEVKELKDIKTGDEVLLNPITDEMIDGDSGEVSGAIVSDSGFDEKEQEELRQFLDETGANKATDLPGVDTMDEDNGEEGPEQDILENIVRQTEIVGPDDKDREPVTDQEPQPKNKEPRTKEKKQKRVDVGRDLMPEAYTAQDKKMFTPIANWEDVRNAIKTKRLVRAEVTQVNDEDKMITVRFDNIRGIIPYDYSGVEDQGRSLVWLVGRTICFVIEKADEKNEGGFFVANRSKGLEALAAEVRKYMKVGSIRQAVVSKIEPWGVWVEMGGVYGRLAKRDLLHSFVANIAEILQPGNLIDVKITKVSDTGRIQVSLKDALPDPWQKVPYTYKVGAIASGTITGFIPDLIFIEIEPGVNAVASFPNFPVKVGQKVAAKIRWIDIEKKRMSSTIWKAV